ncbi:MAG TPA: COX15/CtaA family protein [Candidatus Thiothrix moscowensis]|uniref:COX15/CtaA family protein n=1 Tax=unclassified Thiothrix TaxID=2636184 RepID=UPI0025D7B8B5|nr:MULTISPECIES: COX15/CtaA family protein [unclassified Thiothrix]HRJ53023.1 COX15/CtaA family protein [Candidatus Thiothrix moscowensis]HRJ92933.1 COX15/CtaA family protein [Candidatus Thiothrix moscowensis]
MKRVYSYLLSVALLLVLVVIILGAYTRLSDAGLGCPDWPGCYGHLIVPESVDASQFERPLEPEKAWAEMIHRYVAGTLGLLILALFLVVVFYRRQIRQGLLLPFLLLCTVTFQAALGMWTVTLLLSPLIVTAHLLGGFATLSLLWLLWLNQHSSRPNTLYSDTLGGVRILGVLALLLLLVQIFLGGWTSTHYAAVACGTSFPTCHGEWWPAADFAKGFAFEWQEGVNYEFGVLENPARTAIHLAHRLGALTVFLFLGGFAVWLLAKRLQILGSMPALLLLLLLVQVTLGILNVVMALPLPVATAHTLVAALLLLVVIALNHRLYPAR